MPVSVCVDPHLFETDSTGRLTARTHAARMLATRTNEVVRKGATLPGDDNTSVLTLPWDVVEYEYGTINATPVTGRFQVRQPGLYHVSVSRQDNSRPSNILPDRVMVGLEIVVNGTAIARERVPRLYQATHALSVSTDTYLDAADIVQARWTVMNAPARRDDHLLTLSSANQFSIHWVGYRRARA